MTAVRKLAPIPAPPASHVRAVGRCPLPTIEEHAACRAAELAPLRARASRYFAHVDAEVADLRSRAMSHRGIVGARGLGPDAAAVENRVALALDAEARALKDAADELRWLAGLRP
jgi:hypothetical protein